MGELMGSTHILLGWRAIIPHCFGGHLNMMEPDIETFFSSWSEYVAVSDSKNDVDHSNDQHVLFAP